MRSLILVVAGLLIWGIIRYYGGEKAARSSASTPRVPDLDRAAREQRTLKQILDDAGAYFAESREGVNDEQPDLRSALATLQARCEALAERVSGEDGVAGGLRQPILRLLLPLNGVVRRAAKATHRTASVDRDALLASCTDAISRAAEQLVKITEKADEVALRRLEIDLEVLEGRLSEAE